MESLLRNLVWEATKQIALIGFLLIPVFIAAWRLVRLRQRHKRKAVVPFTGRPLRPPGESLRLKVQELDEKITDEVFMLLAPTAFVAAVAGMSFRSAPWPFLAVLFLLIMLYVIWRSRRLFTTARTLWSYRLGFDGERVVGEELNQLMLAGYRVFHDFPCDTFNIDHIIVGPSGVYAVETKTRRKPADENGKKLAWSVTYDGRQLHFPGSLPDARWPEQAMRSAQHLSKWLSSATGEPISAFPVLVIPGWLIERKAVGVTRVLNEKEVRYALSPATSGLSPEMVQRIAHQLGEKCRLPAAE